MVTTDTTTDTDTSLRDHPVLHLEIPYGHEGQTVTVEEVYARMAAFAQRMTEHRSADSDYPLDLAAGIHLRAIGIMATRAADAVDEWRRQNDPDTGREGDGQ